MSTFVSTGEYLVRLLETHDVEYVFGIPGVHTAELYRGLAKSPIQHITPRHEQGAGFMADGYARVTGKPGICLLITGPGLSNAATAMLQARADSIPMLVITGVNDLNSVTRGHLHEMPDQSAFAKTVAVQSHTIGDPSDLEAILLDAYQLFETQRPGPVHIEIPLSIMRANCADIKFESKRVEAANSIDKKLQASIDKAIVALNESDHPMLIVGGGAGRAKDAVIELAERLDCAVVTTVNARAYFPHGHPLHVFASPSLDIVRQALSNADTVLAIGTEIGPTDFDMYETGEFPKFKNLIHLDISESQLVKNGNELCGSASQIINAILSAIKPKKSGGRDLALGLIQAARKALSVEYSQHIELLDGIRVIAKDCIFVGDSTQMTYAGNLCFEPGDQGAWFNSSTGFGTLGYALPSALGAKLGAPNQPVIAMVGDVGLQFVLAELGTMRDLGHAVVILLWNNQGSGEIRDYMLEKKIEPDGVDLMVPDFRKIAHAYDIDVSRTSMQDVVLESIKRAIVSDKSILIEIDAA